jgi:hypothetical protein
MIVFKNKTTLSLFTIIILVWLIGFFVAVFSPENVLSTYPFLSNYVDLINVFLTVKRYSSKSHFPQIALLYNAIILPFFPLYLALGWRYWLAQTKGGLAIRLQKDIKQFSFGDYCFLLFFAIPLLSMVGWAALFIWNGSDTRMASIGSSRFQLGLIGIFIPLLSALLFAGAVLSIKKIIFRKI